ncbi:MAG: hypothetical protein ACRD2B_11720, partial [Terriglobia bacterium]
PCIVLAALSIGGGFVETPHFIGDIHGFTNFLHSALPAVIAGHAGTMTELTSELWVTLALVIGVVVTWYLYMIKPSLVESLTSPAAVKLLHRYWFSDWGMDWLYDHLFVKPIMWFARVDKGDIVDAFYTGCARVSEAFYRGLRTSENGRVRWYAAGIVLGSIIFVAIALFA